MAKNKEGMNDNKILEIAHQIIRGNCINFNSEQTFGNISSIYRFTNEDVTAYFHHLEKRKNMLTVIGSGAPVLNGILAKTFNYDVFDITVFPEWYLFLQLASIISLEEEDYFKYYLSNDRDELFNEYFYEKISDNLKGKYKIWWDSLYMFNDGIDIYDSLLFRQDPCFKKIAIENNPYLQENNYKKLKHMLQTEGIRINPFVADITQTRFEDEYELVNLSNILSYCFDENSLKEYISFLQENFLLTENGEIINYFYTMKSSTEEKFSELLQPNGYIENIRGKKLLVYKK